MKEELAEKIEAMKLDERKALIRDGWTIESHDEKMSYNAALEDVLNLLKSL